MGKARRLDEKIVHISFQYLKIFCTKNKLWICVFLKKMHVLQILDYRLKRISSYSTIGHTQFLVKNPEPCTAVAVGLFNETWILKKYLFYSYNITINKKIDRFVNLKVKYQKTISTTGLIKMILSFSQTGICKLDKKGNYISANYHNIHYGEATPYNWYFESQ